VVQYKRIRWYEINELNEESLLMQLCGARSNTNLYELSLAKQEFVYLIRIYFVRPYALQVKSGSLFSFNSFIS
jgi:hypothetical protein